MFLQNLSRVLRKFVNFAKSQPKWMDRNKIKCSCNQRKCRNMAFRDKETVTSNLLTKGFVPRYYEWTLHGEVVVMVDSIDILYSASMHEEKPSNAYETMVMDVVKPDFNSNMEEEPPNPEAQAFYDMLSAVKKSYILVIESIRSCRLLLDCLALSRSTIYLRGGFD